LDEAAGRGHAEIPPQFELPTICGHPQFPAAMRTFAEKMVGLHSRNRMFSWFLNDRTLAILAHAAVSLDADMRDDDPRSGLTPGRIKSFCARAGLCSEGRATAILAFMRLTGHLVAETHPADRRITRLRPGEKLMETTRARTAHQFASAALVCPDIASGVERLADPAFERDVFTEFHSRFPMRPYVVEQFPEMRLFTDRDAGMMTLFVLMLGADPSDSMPPGKPVPLSIAALARQFGVSRTHVLRLIRDAEGAGMLTRVGDKGEQVAFAPRLREGLSNLVAALFQLAALCMWAAMGKAGDMQPEA
jgi:hypothetical protein